MNLDIEKVLGLDLPGSLARETHSRAMAFDHYRFEPADDMLANLARVESEWGSPPLAVIHNGACSSTTEVPYPIEQ